MSIPSSFQLLTRLVEGTAARPERSRLTVLNAPAGYGKTETVARWLGDPLERTPGLRWIRCTPASKDTFWGQFADTLADAVDAPAPPSGDPVTAARSLAETLTAPLTIVIDDYHHATNSANDQALADLSLAAPRLALVVLARRLRVLDGPLITGRAPIRVFGTRDLALSDEHAYQLAAQLHVPHDERLQFAIQQANGWPLAVRAAIDPLHLLDTEDPGALAAPGHADPSGETSDPLTNLARFALHHLEILDDDPRRLLLAAAVLDAIDLEQAADLLGVPIGEARAATYELLELGVLVGVTTPEATEFRCHPAVQAPLAARAQRSTSIDRHALLTARARILSRRDPLTAFQHLCQAEDYASAEALLIDHYFAITSDIELCLTTLSAIPESVLLAHPAFIAAQLKLKFPDSLVPTSTIEYLIRIWGTALAERTRDLRIEQWDLEVLGQVMVAERVHGHSERAAELGTLLDSRMTRQVTPREGTNGEPVEEFTIFHHEIAVTALGVGDLTRARKHWGLLTVDPQHRGPQHWSATPVQGRSSELQQVLLTLAHQELAFTELLDGNFHGSANHLRIADELQAEVGGPGAGTSWVSAELARAHLSNELVDASLYEVAAARLEGISDRIERWPLQLLAEANYLRHVRGNDWAFANFGEGVEESERGRGPAGRWRDHLTAAHAALAIFAGDFVTAERQLGRLPAGSPVAALENARRALFAGDDVGALLLAEAVSERTVVRRQAVDRSLICAIAAWGCGDRTSAFSQLRNAADLITEFLLTSRLWGVPFDVLDELASAASDAGEVDIRGLVASIPEPARAFRYERLTGMEHRALEAVAAHGSTKDAASALFVTPGTVKKHLAAVYRKLRVNGREEAVLRATRMGVLDRTGH